MKPAALINSAPSEPTAPSSPPVKLWIIFSCHSPPLGGQLVNGALAIRTSVGRCPIEVARSVEDYHSPGTEPIRVAGEAIQHALGPRTTGRCQLEYHAATIASTNPACTASDGCAVEIACGIEGHPTVGVLSVVEAAEAVQHALLPLASAAGRQLEDRPTIGCPSSHRCTVRIAGAIEGQL